MKKNLLFKKNIKKYQNNEIDINDVIVDKNNNKNYSLKDDFEDIKYLVQVAHGFIDRNFLLNEIVFYNTEEAEQKELIQLIMEEDDLIDHFMEMSDIVDDRTKAIIRTFPLLPDDWLQKNMSFFIENIDILFVSSEKVRKIYFEEVRKNGMSGVNGLEDCVCAMYNYLNNKDSFDVETIEAIKGVFDLFKTEKENFFQIYKRLQTAYYKDDIMSCFLDFEIKDKRQVNVGVLKDYLNFIEKSISEAGISLEDSIRTNFKNGNANIFATESSFFNVIINKFMDEKKYGFIYELFFMCKEVSEKPDFVFISTTQDFDKNKKYLFLINSEVEKNKIMESLREPAVSTKHTVKRL